MNRASILLLLFTATVHHNEAHPTRYEGQSKQRAVSKALFNGLGVYSFAVGEIEAKDEHNSPYDARRDCLYRAYLLFTIFGVIGAVIGIIFLVRQTKATEHAANAARDNAIAVINAERAWVMVNVDYSPGQGLRRAIGADETGFYVRFNYTNDGKTPAWIVEKRFGAIIQNKKIPFSQEPNFESLQTVERERIPVSPGKTTPPKDIWVQAEGIQGLDDIAIVYGVIKYKDVFSQSVRTTAFGYEITIGEKYERMSAEYPRYNENT